MEETFPFSSERRMKFIDRFNNCIVNTKQLFDVRFVRAYYCIRVVKRGKWKILGL